MSKLKMMDFYADWCGPCRTLSPIVSDLMKDYSDPEKTGVIIEKIDVDKNQELASKYGIRSIPTIVFERDGEVLEKVSGIQSKETLISKIESYTN
jgi:thioredoxin 1